MDAVVEATVANIIDACRRDDRQAFGTYVGDLKAIVVSSSSNGHIGPALAFRTLSPAGDAIGEAMLEIDAGKASAWLAALATDRAAAIRSIACRAVGHYGTRYPQEALDLAHILASDESWEVREFIANALDEVMCTTQGDYVYIAMESWVHDPNPNVRRAPTNALMRYGRQHPERVIRLMRELRRDDSHYVRDNVVFCLGVMGAVKVQAISGAQSPANPDILLASLNEWLSDEDERTRWIIARTLGRKWALARLEQSLQKLKKLAADPHKGVRAAVVSSLKELAKSAPDAISAELGRWRGDADEQVRDVAAKVR
jgi:HEAT repeat protein